MPNHWSWKRPLENTQSKSLFQAGSPQQVPQVHVQLGFCFSTDGDCITTLSNLLQDAPWTWCASMLLAALRWFAGTVYSVWTGVSPLEGSRTLFWEKNSFKRYFNIDFEGFCFGINSLAGAVTSSFCWSLLIWVQALEELVILQPVLLNLFKKRFEKLKVVFQFVSCISHQEVYVEMNHWVDFFGVTVVLSAVVLLCLLTSEELLLT